MSTSNLLVEAISDADALARIRDEWDALCTHDPESTVFQTPAWLLSWWKHRGHGRLWVLTARRNGELVALAPLCISRWPYPMFRCVQFLGENGSGTTVYADAIATTVDRKAACSAFLEYIARNHGDWDLVELMHVRAGSALSTIATPEGLVVARDHEENCYSLQLPGEGRTFESSLPTKLRANLLRRRQHLARDGSVSYEVVTTDIEDTLRALFDMHRARFRGRGDMFDASPAEIAFHVEAATELAARGSLHLVRLRVDREVAAICYGMRHRDKAYMYMTSSDDRWARHGVGLDIRARLATDVAASGARELDLLRGPSEWKLHWRAEARPVLHVAFASPRRVSTAALWLSRTTLHVFQEMLRSGWMGQQVDRGPLESVTTHFAPQFAKAAFTVMRRRLLKGEETSKGETTQC